jgi:hypothetical protein
MLNKTKHVMVFHVIVIESLLHDSWDYIKTSIHLKGETDVNRHSIQNMLFVCLKDHLRMIFKDLILLLARI